MVSELGVTISYNITLSSDLSPESLSRTICK